MQIRRVRPRLFNRDRIRCASCAIRRLDNQISHVTSPLDISPTRAATRDQVACCAARCPLRAPEAVWTQPRSGSSRSSEGTAKEPPRPERYPNPPRKRWSEQDRSILTGLPEARSPPQNLPKRRQSKLIDRCQLSGRRRPKPCLWRPARSASARQLNYIRQG